MPDFFIDRFVTYEGELGQFSAAVAKVAGRRGGNIHGIRQTELRGGNAANTAAALAMLGAQVYPIITTDALGLHLLRFYLGTADVDLSYVKDNGKVSLTTAIEILSNKERANIMMGDVGSLRAFGPKDLTERDFKLLREADYVCVFNWAATRKYGTDLARVVFKYVKEKGKAKTYFDSGDPTPNEKSIPKLVKNVLRTRLLDCLSVNENEVFQFARHLDEGVDQLKGGDDRFEAAKACARVLAKHLVCRVDLHTSTFAGSFTKDGEVIVPAFSVESVRSTGAGDSWDAGNIYGDALKLPDSCRLTLANAVAAYYVSSKSAKHPTIPELIEFCQEGA
jgi:sugar/nucleoside kinase (ribokinase family)